MITLQYRAELAGSVEDPGVLAGLQRDWNEKAGPSLSVLHPVG